MAHTIEEPIQIRDRNVITIPKDVRKILNVSIGDWVGFDVYSNDQICIHKIVPHRMRNTNKCTHGGVDAEEKS